MRYFSVYSGCVKTRTGGHADIYISKERYEMKGFAQLLCRRRRAVRAYPTWRRDDDVA